MDVVSASQSMANQMFVFPIPVRFFKLSTVNDETIPNIIKLIDSFELETRERIGSWTKSQNFLNHPDLSDVRKEVLKCLEFFRSAEQHTCSNLEIVSSWANVLGQNEQIKGHVHPNSYISGVVHLNEGSDFVINQPPSTDLYFINLGEGKQENFKIQPGTLIVFPSNLNHGTWLHTSANPRYSIAVNCLPRVFGSELSHVNLK